MARPLSDDKRAAILAAAVDLIAELGLGSTPTSAISKRAKVAEGTLFTYFKTKDDLINALYGELKQEMARVMMPGFPSSADTRTRIKHVWDRFVKWGAAHPRHVVVLAQLDVSGRLTAESIAAGTAPFAEIEIAARDGIKRGELKNVPLPFLAGVMQAMSDATMKAIAKQPRAAAKYTALGFEIFWAGVAKP